MKVMSIFGTRPEMIKLWSTLKKLDQLNFDILVTRDDIDLGNGPRRPVRPRFLPIKPAYIAMCVLGSLQSLCPVDPPSART